MGVLGGRWEEDGAFRCIACMDELDAVVIFHHLRPRYDVYGFC
jgi:hypothetical protein